jgi:tetratricopeptide (TPR) repeat protein
LGSRFCFSLVCLGLLYGADQPQVVFEKAAAALAAHDYAGAERGFRAVLQAEPGSVGALGNLGVVYSRTHRYVQAVVVYERALRIAPGDAQLETNLGLAYVKQERYAQALPIFEKLAAQPSDDSQARELLATCRLALGQFEPALALLEPLRSADPKNAGVLYMLGVAYLKLKRTSDAHAVWTQMMEAVSPAQANFLMGKAGYEMGRFEEAASYFRKTLAADPGFDGAHRELGKTLISLRHDAGARKELRQAAPDDSEAAYFLGALLAKAGDAGAIPLLIKAREENPDSWGVSYYLGRIYLEQGQTKEALEFLERAARARPDEAAVQYQLGRALRKSGRDAEARAAFARVKGMKTASLEKESEIVSPRQGPW